MRERDYEALVMPSQEELDQLKDVTEVFRNLAENNLMDEGVKPTAIAALDSLSAAQESLADARWLLALRLHDQGVPLRVVAEALHVSQTTAQRRINARRNRETQD